MMEWEIDRAYAVAEAALDIERARLTKVALIERTWCLALSSAHQF
jgi:hypothetical protein